MNRKQKEATSKTFLDIAKTILAVFVVGGFIPGSPITSMHMIVGILWSVIIYLAAMLLLRGENHETS